MTPHPDTPSRIDAQKRRVTDQTSGGPRVIPADDPEMLYQALRNGQYSLAAMAHLAPVDVIFSWHAQRKISEAEFTALLAAQEVHEVHVGDVAKAEGNDPDVATKRLEIMAAALKSRLETLTVCSGHDVIGEEEMKPVFLASQPLLDGIGIRIVFSAPPNPPEEAGPPAPTGTLTLLCRAYIASTSIRSAAKCEAVFMAEALPGDLYCRIVLPMPLVKGGRRRLFVSVLDNETRHPINLPLGVAELFQEKYIQQIQLMRSPVAAGAGLGGLVKSTFGRLFSMGAKS